MLLQYGYPIIDPKNLIESISLLAEQLTKTFVGSSFNLRPYLKEAEHQLRYTLNLDSNSVIDLRNFSREELSHAVEYTMKSEVFDPLADIWSSFRLASRYPKCARFILCRQNAPPLTRTSLGLKEGITRASSAVVAWALEKTNNRGMPSFSNLYAAAMDGALGLNCEVKYQGNCDKVLNGPNPSMRLDFEHHEL